jgi:hypothetical protein
MKFLFIISLVITNSIFAQDRFLDIAINNTQFYAKDTIAISTDYVDDYNAKADGTLYIKIMNDKGLSWNYRWPIYKGLCTPKIILPADIEKGFYHIYFATRDEKFLVKGNLVNNQKNDRLNATLYNRESLIVTNDIPINYDNSFTYTNPYFRNTAILFFKNSGDKGKKPNIKIESILDSVFMPTASKKITIKVGNLATAKAPTNIPKNYADMDSFLGKRKVIQMEAVTVKATNKVKATSFEKEYISDRFKDVGERTLNLFDDDPGLYGQTLFYYLQTSIPSLNVPRDDLSNLNMTVTMRGNPMVFYLDQVEIPTDAASNIDLNDIAIIKVFNPPFSSNTNADAGAIALFTKKDTNKANGKNSFIIKGYSSPLEVLELGGKK